MPLTRPGCTLVLDVSAAQPASLDFAAAAALGCRAALCKAGQGQASPDLLYPSHTLCAAAAGLMVGSYWVLEAHWPTVDEQARQYFEAAHDSSMLCPVVDVERTGASSSIPLEQVAERAADFVEASSVAWARVSKPRGLLYTGADYLAQMRATPRGLAALQRVTAAGWGLWLAAYRPTEPAPREGAPWPAATAWQWTGGGVSVGGVEVDLSWFQGDERQLSKLGAAI